MDISTADRTVLREMARRVAEIGILPVQKEKAERWRAHNDLKQGRPMVLIFPEGAWREMPLEVKTEGRDAHALERDLRTRLYYWEHMRDDNVIEPVVYTYPVEHKTGWGLAVNPVRPEQTTGAAHYDPVIRENSDLDKIKVPRLTFDREATEQRYSELRELFDGVLAVERRCYTLSGMAIMDLFAQWRGLDQLFLDLVDRPRSGCTRPWRGCWKAWSRCTRL